MTSSVNFKAAQLGGKRRKKVAQLRPFSDRGNFALGPRGT